MRIRPALTAVALCIVAASALPAQAAPDYVVFSGPGSYLTTYTVPASAVQVGATLTYINADAATHDVVARRVIVGGQCSSGCGPDTMFFCGPEDPSQPEDEVKNPRRFPLGQCPVLWSPLIPITKTTPVYGTQNLVAGTLYPFYCTLHPFMTGQIAALPAA